MVLFKPPRFLEWYQRSPDSHTAAMDQEKRKQESENSERLLVISSEGENERKGQTGRYPTSGGSTKQDEGEKKHHNVNGYPPRLI
jgi:hypothetical protein